MYKRIEAQMVLVGMSREELAKATGIPLKSLLAKLNGTQPFSLDDALQVRAAIHATETMEVLFQRD